MVVVSRDPDGWAWRTMDAQGRAMVVSTERWECSAHAQASADALGLGVPVLVR